MEKTTIQLLTQYLPKYGWPAFKVIEDGPTGGKILTGWGSPLVGESRMMFISIDHRQNTMLVVVPALVSAPQERMSIGQLADVLAALGFANFALSIGRYCYDPSDGEIRYEIGLPIDAAEITFEQFEHLMNIAQAAVTYWAPRIKAVADGERTGASVVQSFLGHVQEFAAH
jgi:hypothetical protein